MAPCSQLGQCLNGAIILLNLCAVGYVLSKAIDFLVIVFEYVERLWPAEKDNKARFKEGDAVLYADEKNNWRSAVVAFVETRVDFGETVHMYNIVTDGFGELQVHPEAGLKEYDPPTVEDLDGDFAEELKLTGFRVASCIFFFTIGFYLLEEDHSVQDCFHFTICTLTTVGYGDWAPETAGGKNLCCVAILGGISLITQFAGSIIGYVQKRAFLKVASDHLNNGLVSERQFHEYDQNGNGEIDRFEYVTASLVMCNFCDAQVIDFIMVKFNEVDRDGSGEIDLDDFRARNSKVSPNQTPMSN